MNSLVHFEIHATDPEKLAGFYREVFGWDIKKWEMPGLDYLVVMTCPKDAPNAINGGIVSRKGPAPQTGAPVSGYVCTMIVENVDVMIEKTLKAGGQVALPKMAIPGMAWQAYCIDTDGNIFGLHQTDVSAK